MGNELKQIKQQQKEWANMSGVVQTEGYCATAEINLPWLGLAPRIRSDIESGDGNEFRDTDILKGRAKIAALHSSSALVANVLGYWYENPDHRLAKALGLPAGIHHILFERKFATGVGPKAPNLDVTLTLSDGSLLAIESKFSESYAGSGRKIIQDKYFPPGRALWDEVGLPGAQQAADSLREVGKFQWLDVPQLLKHMLGLGKQLGKTPWQLMLLWYDVPGSAAETMREEIGRFRKLLGDDSKYFVSKTWQEVWHSLLPLLGEDHANYRDYVGKRYFLGPVGQ